MTVSGGDELVVVGRIVRVHGLKGDVVVRPASDGADLLLEVTHVTLRRKSTDERREIHAARALKGKKVIIGATAIELGDHACFSNCGNGRFTWIVPPPSLVFTSCLKAGNTTDPPAFCSASANA